MRTIDLVMTLIVRIALIIGGSGLIYNGGMGLASDLMMYRVMGASNPEMVLVFAGGHAAMLLGGLVIVVFAAFGIVRAVRLSRLTPEAEADSSEPQTLSFGRVISALAFGAGALFGFVTLAPAAVTIADIMLLAVAGKSAVATVQPVRQQDGPVLRYSFTVEGKRYTGSSEIGPNLWPKVRRLTKVDVRYLAWNPAHSEVNESDDVSRAAFFLATRLGLIIVGIWGVWKNLRRPPGSPAPASRPDRPQFDIGEIAYVPERQLKAVPSGAPRSTFGRRNA